MTNIVNIGNVSFSVPRNNLDDVVVLSTNIPLLGILTSRKLYIYSRSETPDICIDDVLKVRGCCIIYVLRCRIYVGMYSHGRRRITGNVEIDASYSISRYPYVCYNNDTLIFICCNNKKVKLSSDISHLLAYNGHIYVLDNRNCITMYDRKGTVLRVHQESE